jgi:poly(3-hydroxybutyrate) depolymerase
MKKVYVLIFASIFSAIGAIAADGTGTITSGSISRTFNYHTPPSASEGFPLMIMMHGDGGSGSSIASYCGMNAAADLSNFIVVYPDALNGSWNRYADNAPGDLGLGNPNAPDDVQYISDLIDHFCVTYNINAKKVYASGHSAGAFMAYNLAISLNAKITAIAPVAGSLWGENNFLSNALTSNALKTPVYAVHGDADPTVGYPDADNTPVAYGEWPLTGFSAANCGTTTYSSSVTLMAGVKVLTFCGSGSEVLLIDIIGGGHGWPNVAGYNVAQSIFDFCNQYQLASAQSCLSNSALTAQHLDYFKVYPNPSNGVITISNGDEIKNVTAFDVTGKAIDCIANEAGFVLKTTPGIVFVKIETKSTQIVLQKIIIQ